MISLGVAAGIAINFWIIWANDQSTGLLAPQDVILFRIFLTKPYTKTYAVFLGMATALVYNKLNRIEPNSWLNKNMIFRLSMYFISVLVIFFVCLYPKPAQ